MSEPATPNPDLARGPSQTGYLRARLNGMAMQDLRELAAFVIATTPGAALERMGFAEKQASPDRERLLTEIHLAIDRKVEMLLDLARKANEEGAFNET